MRKFLLLGILLFCTHAAQAATFDSVIDTSGLGWRYVFIVKSGKLPLGIGATGTPVIIYEYSCVPAYSMDLNNNGNMDKTFVQSPKNCFNNESEARVNAQKMADQHESDMRDNKISSDDAEKARLKNNSRPIQ